MPDTAEPFTDEELDGLLTETEGHSAVSVGLFRLVAERFRATIDYERRKLALAVEALEKIKAMRYCEHLGTHCLCASEAALNAVLALTTTNPQQDA